MFWEMGMSQKTDQDDAPVSRVTATPLPGRGGWGGNLQTFTVTSTLWKLTVSDKQ